MSGLSLLDLLTDKIDDTYGFYDALREAGPVSRDKSGIHLVTHQQPFAFSSDRTFACASPEQRRELIGSGFSSLLMFRAGAAHRDSRRIFTPLFSAARLVRIRARAEEKAADVTASLGKADRYDFVEQVAAPMAVCALSELLGITEDQTATLLGDAQPVAALLAAVPMDPASLTASISTFSALVRQLGAALDGQPQIQNDPHPVADLWQSAMTDAPQRQVLAANLALLLVTGFDTSRLLLANSAATLLAHPQVLQGLGEVPELGPQVADELIRLDGPGQIVFRHALTDTTIGGQIISRGEMVALLIGAGNRDPEVFDRPHMLDVGRSKTRSLSFGSGPHACIGAGLARALLMTMLNLMAEHLSRCRLTSHIERPRQHGLLRGYDRLFVEVAS
jgi:pimeloyl-[acyl-carrier protein] synthase